MFGHMARGLGQSVEEKIENPENKYLTFQMVEVC